ncbi:multiple organellar RNA editing factor 7, mitochondrial [Actinidia eriantha]|uniref:multiple organellar RNA editing factor 7, mitochondrial n=1 Tax=Actinidia eriantha TaxID=165200 RepID=UPI00258D87AC|nr:multiple organellar RNA editing factor 7, mitochondrial [Actinidia eriantha]
MIRRNILGRPLKSTAAAVFHCLKPHHTSAPDVSIRRSRHNPLTSRIGRFSTDSAVTDSAQPTELIRVVDGCDYEHWLVVTEPPNGYPQRSEIAHRYIQTLAMALGSEDEAKKSIYSVSTKYYYAFGCKIPENLTHKIKSLPDVRWVLPDAYLSHCHEHNDYGGEPFVEGDVVPYDEKYHADWLRDNMGDQCQNRTRSRRSRRKKGKGL